MEEEKLVSQEAADGLQNALERIEQARLAVVGEQDPEARRKAVTEYLKVRKDTASAFAEAQRQYDLIEQDYPGA